MLKILQLMVVKQDLVFENLYVLRSHCNELI